MRIGVRDSETLSAEQRAFFNSLENGPRGKVALPFRVLAEVPALATAVSAVGAELRYGSTLAPRLRELAILAVAAAARSGIEWRAHEPLARSAGAGEEEIRYAADASVAPAAEDAKLVVDAVRELMTTGALSCADDVIAALGRRQTTELVVAVGYYRLLAMAMAVAGNDVALPHGGQA